MTKLKSQSLVFPEKEVSQLEFSLEIRGDTHGCRDNCGSADSLERTQDIHCDASCVMM